MKGYVYILECANNKYYIGSTNNLHLRLQEHETEGGAQYCKIHHPFKLVCTEEYDRMDKAFEREQQLKKWSHAKKEVLIKGDFDTLKRLSRSKKVGEIG